MLTIEHTSTRIQNESHLDSRDLPGLEGLPVAGKARRKGRPTGGALGVFAKIFAGLVNKKAGPENTGLVVTEKPGSKPRFTGGGRKNRAGFPAAQEGVQNRREASGAVKKKPPREREGPAPGEAFPLVQDPVKERILRPQGTTIEGMEAPSPAPVLYNPEEKPQAGEFSAQPLPLQNQEIPAPPVQEAPPRTTERKEPAPEEGREGLKKTGRRKDRFTVQIRDLRSGDAPGPDLRGPVEVRVEADREIIVDLRHSRETPENASRTGGEVSAGERFEQVLARELKGGLQGDIIKQAAIVLRDGGEGTIRLSLQPQTLGKVKIHLEMAENKVSGHIFVETEEALRAFEQEIHSLEQGFKDSGFGEVSLSTTLDSRNGGQKWQNTESGPFYSQRFALSGYDGGVEPDPAETPGGYGFGFSAVNMLV
ncbi:MAG: flagellar hook-length control protein FliK [Spirochaetaceae bacterium]|jgi:hypothetical protein|nr:flagellar hook-length control protein FliK [Spirochaetaceae bacterium]